MQSNINEEETINIKETTEILKTTNPNEMWISLLDTEKDGNCLINSLLKSLGIDTKYSISVRKLLGNLIREANIDENIIRVLN